MSLIEPMNRYGDIIRAVAELTNLSVPPAGWRGVIFPAIDHLRASSAPGEMIEAAERISVALLQLDWAVHRSDVAKQENVRENLSMLCESWRSVFAPQSVDEALELGEFETISEVLERLNGVDTKNEPRHPVDIHGRYELGDGVEQDVTVNDLSIHGCCLFDRFGNLEPGGFVSLQIGSIGPVQAHVRWRRETNIGIEFSRPLDPSAFEHMRATIDGWSSP